MTPRNITVYLLGETAPNFDGLLYEDYDSADEAATDNGLTVFAVAATITFDTTDFESLDYLEHLT